MAADLWGGCVGGGDGQVGTAVFATDGGGFDGFSAVGAGLGACCFSKNLWLLRGTIGDLDHTLHEVFAGQLGGDKKRGDDVAGDYEQRSRRAIVEVQRSINDQQDDG